MLTITKEEAQQFLLHHFQLNDKVPLTDENVTAFLKRIKTVQYDVLNVVGTNVDLVFQSRFEDYQIGDAQDYLYSKRMLVDGWDKMMSLYAMSDYVNMEQARQEYAQKVYGSLQYRFAGHTDTLVSDVYQYIHENGPIRASDVKIVSHDSVSTGWGNTRMESMACDYLFASGKIGIAYKKKSIKYYDTAEKLNHPKIDTHKLFDQEAFIDWYLLRRIQGQGIVWNRSGGAWLSPYISLASNRKKGLERLKEMQKIVEVQVKGQRHLFYMSKENSEKFLQMREQQYENSPRVRFVAPLDNLIWDREFVKCLFDFDYKWEVYTPVKDRKYGYYVLPILYGSKFVGRVEMKVVDDTLQLLNVWYEAEIIQDDIDFQNAFQEELQNFQRYLRLT